MDTASDSSRGRPWAARVGGGPGRSAWTFLGGPLGRSARMSGAPPGPPTGAPSGPNRTSRGAYSDVPEDSSGVVLKAPEGVVSRTLEAFLGGARWMPVSQLLERPLGSLRRPADVRTDLLSDLVPVPSGARLETLARGPFGVNSETFRALRQDDLGVLMGTCSCDFGHTVRSPPDILGARRQSARSGTP